MTGELSTPSTSEDLRSIADCRTLFAGTWQLVSYEVHRANGVVRYPLGKHAVGYIMYGLDGYMSVAMMSNDRPTFAGNDMMAGSTQERSLASRTYLSYSGTYDVYPDTVVHHVEVSLFPNWVGTDQVRYYHWDGETLTLSTASLLLEGAQGKAVLRWRKVPGGVS